MNFRQITKELRQNKRFKYVQKACLQRDNNITKCLVFAVSRLNIQIHRCKVTSDAGKNVLGCSHLLPKVSNKNDSCHHKTEVDLFIKALIRIRLPANDVLKITIFKFLLTKKIYKDAHMRSHTHTHLPKYTVFIKQGPCAFSLGGERRAHNHRATLSLQPGQGNVCTSGFVRL